MKKWYRSKSIILNGLVFLGALIFGITGEDWFDGEVQVMVLSLLDLILRAVTKQGLET